MPNAVPIAPRQTLFGLGKETVQGTYVAPTVYIPGMVFKPEDVVGYEDDTSIEANPGKLQGVYQTTKDTIYGFDFNAYYEVLGNFLVALGMVDTVKASRTVADGVTTISTAVITSATANWGSGDVGGAISGAGIPASTTILSVQSATSATMSANATATGSAVSFTIGTTGQTRHGLQFGAAQPPAYSITDYDGFETLGYPGSMLDQFDLTIDAKAMVKAQSHWKGWPAAVQTKPTPSWPALPAALGWQAAYTIGGTANPRILSLGLTAKRNADPIHTSANTQAPYNVFSPEIEASMKLKGLRIDDTERNHLLNNDQPSLVATLVSPTGTPAPSVIITASKTAWKKAPTDRSGKFMQGDYDLDLVYNSTDNGPFQVVIVNGVSAAY